MSFDVESLFSNMANAPLNAKGKYMGEGKYRIRTKSQKVTEIYSKKKNCKVKTFVNVFEVVTSTNPDHAAGSEGTQFIGLDNDRGWGDIKAFVFATFMGLDPDRIKSPAQDAKAHAEATELAKALLSPTHAEALQFPADFGTGQFVDLECIKVKTAAKPGYPDGGEFTVYKFTPVPAAVAQ